MIDDLLTSLDFHLEAKSRSEWTKTQYHRALTRFAAWLGHGDLPAVKPGEIERYLAEMKTPAGRPVSPATRAYHFRGLQAFYKWHAKREGYKNPMRRLSSPSVPETPKDVLTVEMVRKVLADLDAARRLRDAAMVSLLFECGPRTSELCSLDVADVDWKKREILLRATKNGEARILAFGPATGERLDKWCPPRKRKENAPLFTGRGGTRLTRSGVYQALRSIFDGYDVGKIGGHDLRHSFATAFADANPQGREVLKEAGGWKSNAVDRYTRQGRQRRNMEEFRRVTPTSRI